MGKFSYILAPIEDMTDNTFRTLCYKYGADLTFTEMVRVEGLAKKNKCTWERIEFKDDTPTVIQLLGAKEEHFIKFMEMFEPKKNFKGFNLNLGCPSPNFVKLGYGCALIKRISKVKNILKVIEHKGYKCSIKMRLGLNKYEKEKKVYLNLINEVDADFFVVHARYGSQGYDTKPDNKVYSECVKTGKNIIANGDIKTKEQVDELKSIGLKGVMIGREAIKNPCIFSDLKGLPHPNLEEVKKEYLALSDKYSAKFRYRKNVMKWIGREMYKTNR